MASSDEGLTLSGWERALIIISLSFLVVARFLWPDLPIDATTVGLLGLAGLAWKWDIESLEFLGVKAKRRTKELEKTDAKLRALPPQALVHAPSGPKVVREASPSTDWYSRAAGAATDLELPSEPISQILWAAEQIRIDLTILAGNSGHLPKNAPHWPQLQSTRLALALAKQGLISAEIAEAIPSFVEVRNRAAHGHRAATPLLEAAADTGLTLVATLRSIPREWIRIVKSDLTIYTDRAGTSSHSTGVLLVKLGNGGELLHESVYPCTDFLRRGEFVTWQWDESRVSDKEGWYRHPSTGEIKLAWSRSMFFAGRPYPDEWGLMYRFPRPDVGLDDLD